MKQNGLLNVEKNSNRYEVRTENDTTKVASMVTEQNQKLISMLKV